MKDKFRKAHMHTGWKQLSAYTFHMTLWLLFPSIYESLSIRWTGPGDR